MSTVKWPGGEAIMPEFMDCYFCAGSGEVFQGEILGECPKCDGKKLVICGDHSGKECTHDTDKKA